MELVVVVVVVMVMVMVIARHPINMQCVPY